MIVSLSAVLGCYFLSILWLKKGWQRAMRSSAGSPERLAVSVVVPFRNEAERLPSLVENLRAQRLPASGFEVILVDDHSTDGSAEKVKALITALPGFRLIGLREGQGKKAALTQGIAEARGPLIVTTDADCLHPRNWLLEIVSRFDDRTNLLVGPVRTEESNSIFSRLQALEFTSLVVVAAAGVGHNRPLMCNGANLSFRKDMFLAVGGYSGNEHVPSGDDEFLMRKVARKFPGTVGFLPAPGAVVTTFPQATLKDFFNQRLRWAGKWKWNSAPARVAAVLVWVVQGAWLLAMALAVIGTFSPVFFAGLFLAKAGMESMLLVPVAHFLGVKWRWGLFLALQFFYPVYVILVGLLSQGMKYKWKGRTLGPSMAQNP